MENQYAVEIMPSGENCNSGLAPTGCNKPKRRSQPDKGGTAPGGGRGVPVPIPGNGRGAPEEGKQNPGGGRGGPVPIPGNGKRALAPPIGHSNLAEEPKPLSNDPCATAPQGPARV